MVSSASMPSALTGTILFAMQRDEAMRRTHELHVGAVRTLMRHDLRNGAAASVSSSALCRPSASVARARHSAGRTLQPCRPVRARVVHRKSGKPSAAGFLGERRGGLAVFIQRDGNRQHFFTHVFFRRDRAHVLDRDGEAARRGATFERQFAFDQVARRELRNAFSEGVAETRERFRRQFFGQQLDERCLMGLESVMFSSVLVDLAFRLSSGSAHAGMAASCSSIVRPGAPSPDCAEHQETELLARIVVSTDDPSTAHECERYMPRVP